MKIEDISKIMENMDERHIKEAVNYKPKNRNITRIIALAACIAILVTAIPAALILNREDAEETTVATTPAVTEMKTHETGDKTPPQTDPKPIDIIYCSAGTDASEREALKNVFEELSDKKIDVQELVECESAIFWEYEKVEYSDDIPKTLNFTLGGEEYNCTFDYAYNTGAILSTNETLRSYAKIARYNVDGLGENGYQRFVLYHVATKEIVRIVNTIKRDESGSIKTNDLIELSEKYLTSLYGEDILSKFTLVNAVGNLVIYRRYIGEFQTTEKITLRFHANGELQMLDTDDLGMFDIVENKIDHKVLLASEAKYQKLSEGQLVSKKTLRMGNDGNPYVCATLRFEKDGKLRSTNLYYKVDTTE